MNLGEEVTLVIPAKGRQDDTRRLLESLVSAGDSYQVILVDDGSEPSLERCAQESGLPGLRYVRVPASRGPAAARNAGVRLASTPFVAFTDNDVTVTPGWMRELVAHLRQAPSDVAGVGGSVADGSGTLVGEYAARLRLLDPFVQRGRVAYLVTANCLFRRTALEAVGGFDESFSHPGGEDPDLSFRLLRRGYRLEVAPSAVVHHHYSGSWVAFAKMFFRYGAGCRKAMRVLAT